MSHCIWVGLLGGVGQIEECVGTLAHRGGGVWAVGKGVFVLSRVLLSLSVLYITD